MVPVPFHLDLRLYVRNSRPFLVLIVGVVVGGRCRCLMGCRQLVAAIGSGNERQYDTLLAVSLAGSLSV